MKALTWMAAAGGMALGLAGCSQSDAIVSPRSEVAEMANADGAPENQFGFMQAMEQPTIFSSRPERMISTIPSMEERSSGETKPMPMPDAQGAEQIAYSYDFGFRVAADELEELQQRHMALCDTLGAECRILNRASSGNGDFGYGQVQLEVAAAKARGFGDSLSEAADGLDAERISFGMSGVDLAKQISDTQARLASRRLLRDRLTEILRTRQGSVGDLVEAERAVAQVNSEIDVATNDLADMRGRIVFSQVAITYDPELGEYTLGFLPPISYAMSQVSTTLGVTIAAIIYGLVALVPLLAVFFGLRWLWRKSGMRLRRPRGEAAAD